MANQPNDAAQDNPDAPEEITPGELTSPGDRRRIQASTPTRRARWAGNTVNYSIPERVRTTHMDLPAGQLVTDPRYNRDIDRKWVEEIARDFNPDQLQTLNVSRRVYRKVQREGRGKQVVEEQVFDGNLEGASKIEYVVISGQHRLLATLEARDKDFVLSCNVYDRLTPEQEAILFAIFDEKIRPHNWWQRHKSRLFGQDAEAMDIERIVAESGMEVFKGKNKSDGVIYAVSTLYSIYRSMGGAFLRRLLEIHYTAWTDNGEGYTASMLQGTAILMRRFGVYARWSDDYLAVALSDPAHNPLTLIQRAKGAASGVGATSVAQEVARLEHRYYQMGKKGYDRLPEWNATPREITLASDAANARQKQTAPQKGEKEKA
jgi:hypothetical protein